MSTANSMDMVSPAPDQVAELAKVSSFLEAHSVRHGAFPAPAFYLSGSSEHDRVELSEQIFALLKDVVDALNRGQSVSIVARDREISTQQAAEILGISRPTVVELINKGDLAATVPGAVRRKLRLIDVLTYRDSLHERRSAFISDSSAEFDEVDDNEASTLLDEARRAR